MRAVFQQFMRFYCFQYSLFHIHICILSQRSPDFHVFSVILVLRKNRCRPMPLQLRSHCRRSPLGAAAFLQLWGAGCCAWRHGASGAVACLVLWCICAVTHLAQRRAWHCGAYGRIRKFPPTAPNRPPFRVFGSVLHRFEPVSRRLSKMILPLAKM